MADSTGSQTSGKPPAQVEPEDLPPFGERVHDKPGFVYSPFAKRHQLVNVEGLTPGIAVRCPYSGKIFRVPMEGTAASGTATPEALTIDGPGAADIPGSPSGQTNPASPARKPATSGSN